MHPSPSADHPRRVPSYLTWARPPGSAGHPVGRQRGAGPPEQLSRCPPTRTIGLSVVTTRVRRRGVAPRGCHVETPIHGPLRPAIQASCYGPGWMKTGEAYTTARGPPHGEVGEALRWSMSIGPCISVGGPDSGFRESVESTSPLLPPELETLAGIGPSGAALVGGLILAPPIGWEHWVRLPGAYPIGARTPFPHCPLSPDTSRRGKGWRRLGWAQTITVGYERDQGGSRAPGQQRDRKLGQVGRSRTFPVPGGAAVPRPSHDVGVAPPGRGWVGLWVGGDHPPPV